MCCQYSATSMFFFDISRSIFSFYFIYFLNFNALCRTRQKYKDVGCSQVAIFFKVNSAVAVGITKCKASKILQVLFRHILNNYFLIYARKEVTHI